MRLSMKSFVFLLVQVIAFASYADDGVTVVGKASAMQVPDTFMLRLHIEERGASAGKLKSRIDLRTNQLIGYAQKLGVKDEAITSNQFSVRVVYPKPSAKVNELYVPKANAIVEIDGQEITQKMSKQAKPTFVVGRSIEFVFEDLALYDQLLDNAVKMGVTRIDPVNSYTSNNQELYQALLEQALENAKTKAMALVKKSGAKLGEVVDIEELSHYQAKPMMMAEMARSSHQSFAGSQTLNAEVRVRFAINH